MENILLELQLNQGVEQIYLYDIKHQIKINRCLILSNNVFILHLEVFELSYLKDSGTYFQS